MYDTFTDHPINTGCRVRDCEDAAQHITRSIRECGHEVPNQGISLVCTAHWNTPAERATRCETCGQVSGIRFVTATDN